MNVKYSTEDERKQALKERNRKNVDYGFNRGKHREYNNGSFIMVA